MQRIPSGMFQKLQQQGEGEDERAAPRAGAPEKGAERNSTPDPGIQKRKELFRRISIASSPSPEARVHFQGFEQHQTFTETKSPPPQATFTGDAPSGDPALLRAQHSRSDSQSSQRLGVGISTPLSEETLVADVALNVNPTDTAEFVRQYRAEQRLVASTQLRTILKHDPESAALVPQKQSDLLPSDPVNGGFAEGSNHTQVSSSSSSLSSVSWDSVDFVYGFDRHRRDLRLHVDRYKPPAHQRVNRQKHESGVAQEKSPSGSSASTSAGAEVSNTQPQCSKYGGSVLLSPFTEPGPSAINSNSPLNSPSVRDEYKVFDWLDQDSNIPPKGSLLRDERQEYIDAEELKRKQSRTQPGQTARSSASPPTYVSRKYRPQNLPSLLAVPDAQKSRSPNDESRKRESRLRNGLSRISPGGGLPSPHWMLEEREGKNYFVITPPEKEPGASNQHRNHYGDEYFSLVPIGGALTKDASPLYTNAVHVQPKLLSPASPVVPAKTQTAPDVSQHATPKDKGKQSEDLHYRKGVTLRDMAFEKGLPPPDEMIKAYPHDYFDIPVRAVSDSTLEKDDSKAELRLRTPDFSRPEVREVESEPIVRNAIRIEDTPVRNRFFSVSIPRRHLHRSSSSHVSPKAVGGFLTNRRPSRRPFCFRNNNSIKSADNTPDTDIPEISIQGGQQLHSPRLENPSPSLSPPRLNSQQPLQKVREHTGDPAPVLPGLVTAGRQSFQIPDFAPQGAVTLDSNRDDSGIVEGGEKSRRSFSLGALLSRPLYTLAHKMLNFSERLNESQVSTSPNPQNHTLATLNDGRESLDRPNNQDTDESGVSDNPVILASDLQVTGFEQTPFRQRYHDAKRSSEQHMKNLIDEVLSRDDLEDNEVLLGFEQDVPEHFPNSPLCPKSLKHRSGGKGICPQHGYRARDDRLRLGSKLPDAASSSVAPLTSNTTATRGIGKSSEYVGVSKPEPAIGASPPPPGIKRDYLMPPPSLSHSRSKAGRQNRKDSVLGTRTIGSDGPESSIDEENSITIACEPLRGRRRIRQEGGSSRNKFQEIAFW